MQHEGRTHVSGSSCGVGVAGGSGREVSGSACMPRWGSGAARARAIREGMCVRVWLSGCIQCTLVFPAVMACPLPAVVRLRAHSRMVAEDLRGLRREVRGLEDRRRRKASERLVAKGRSDISRTAVLLYALNDYRSDCAVAWLAWQHEKRKLEVPDRAVLQSTVEGWVLECDANALGEDLVEQHAGPRSRSGQARAFYRDWAAATWVENVNTEKGVAVPTRAVLEQMAPDIVASAADGWACRRRLLRLAVGERAWACRWRKRVGAYVCRPSTHEVLPLAEMREKAGREK